MRPACLLLPAVAFAAVPAVSSLEVSYRARAVEPGEVLLLTVSAEENLSEVEATAFGRTFLLAPAGDHWEGLVGIDLNTKPADYGLAVRARSPRGPLETETSLTVAAREFPTRHLTVNPKFVTPPPEVTQRIQRESRLLSRVLATVSPEKHWSGSLTRPVPGIALSSFGKRSVFNGQPRSPHTGADFRAAEGTPIVAPAAGRIALARDLYYAGNAVVVDHGLGLLSMMAHLSRIDVAEGEMVAAGDRLGLAGATGRVTGPHLHWALRLAGARVDPVSLLELLRPAAEDQE